MRVTSMAAAGLALILAACGGDKSGTQAGAKPADSAAAGQTAGAAPAAATGATHDVNMVLNGSKYEFQPAELTIKSGDQVRWHNVSGGPHNVQFYPDSIPAGADKVLDANMPEKMGPLAAPLLTEPNAVYTISFANAPTGDYKYYCLPHQALGMKGKITVK
jgi:plastocyanin